MSDTQEHRYPRRFTSPLESNGINYWQVDYPEREPNYHVGNSVSFSIYNELELEKMVKNKVLKETFDHLPSLPEKQLELTNACPMSECLAPARLALLEEFYVEVRRAISEEEGHMKVCLALSRALKKVEQGVTG